MPSLHELKARGCPQPDKPGMHLSSRQPNPDARFGWQVVRKMQSPPPQIQRIGQTDVTPDRIFGAIHGARVVFPGMPVMRPERIKPMTAAEANRRAIEAARAARKKAEKLQRNQGNGEIIRETGTRSFRRPTRIILGYNTLMENVSWFGHASFSFVDKNGNRIYYVDPFDLRVKKLEEADIIFITHAHPDHFSPSDIKKIIKDTTVVVAPLDILEKIDIENGRKIAVLPNNQYEIKGFCFSTIPAYNNHPDKLNFHPKSNNWVGYIFVINGKKVYHAGDTDFIEEMRGLKAVHLDVAMLPMGGNYTMDTTEAAAAANVICAKITVPMHYRRLNQNYEELEIKFKSLVKNSKVVIFEELR